nr:keratin, type I cytoskeletal 9-like isoform X1 [Lepeophtheirus salmonis]
MNFKSAVFFTIIACTIAQKNDIKLKAASLQTNCGCQCNNYIFLDKYGKTQGNCNTVDKSGAKWCYVSRGNTCNDVTYSSRKDERGQPRRISNEACATPVCNGRFTGGGQGGPFGGSSGGSGSFGGGHGGSSFFGGSNGGSGSLGEGQVGSGSFEGSSGGSGLFGGGHGGSNSGSGLFGGSGSLGESGSYHGSSGPGNGGSFGGNVPSFGSSGSGKGLLFGGSESTNSGSSGTGTGSYISIANILKPRSSIQY